MVYYISDLHINDQAIFDKCKRPFASLKEMSDVLMDNWNSIVSPDDIVYVLGDIASDDNLMAIEFYKSLNGHKHLIIGNHDQMILDEIAKTNIFESIKFIDVINDGGKKVCLCHYPLMDWIEFNRNGYLVYGHIHNKTKTNGNAYQQIKEYFRGKPAFNCGVDVTGFKPVSLEEMIELKEKKI